MLYETKATNGKDWLKIRGWFPTEDEAREYALLGLTKDWHVEYARVYDGSERVKLYKTQPDRDVDYRTL